jgi:hypothetical protein
MEPPIIVFQRTPVPETVVTHQPPAVYGQSEATVPSPVSPVPDFTTRVRIFNDYNTVTFTIWIDPVEFDQNGNPTGQSFELAPYLDSNPAKPREYVFRLAPGPHRIYFKSFYPTDYHGVRPRRNGWYKFFIAHRDDPCHICLEISTSSFR